jgi:hypothetical protein
MQKINPGDQFEWIKGENFGKLETVRLPAVQKGAMKFVEFASGRKCNVQLVKEYLNLIATADEMELEDADAFIEKQASLEGVSTPSTNESTKPTSTQSSNSIYIDLITKIKSNEDVKISIPVTLSLPKEDAIKVLLDAYGKDLGDELEAYIFGKIDIESQLKSIIANWVAQFYPETTNDVEEGNILDQSAEKLEE